MTSSLQILLSNQTEVLYERFKEQLFAPQTDPFTKRIVIVPSKAMKSWLSLRLADDLGISAGVEFLFLEPAMRRLQKLLAVPEEHPFIFPSHMELALAIEKEVRRVLEEEKDSLWEPLKSHLIDEKKNRLTAKGEKRLVQLSDQLAGLFSLYEKYGRGMLQRWLSHTAASWQELLWQRVVGGITCEHLDWQRENVSVHLFALSYITAHQHRQLSALAAHVPVSYYLLSPCEAFWSDLLSDRENHRLIGLWEKQGMSAEALTEATELLFERNPLLANWGKLGRLMAAQIEETTPQVDEAYLEPEEESTCLQALQTDLLKLRNGKDLEKRAFENDHSLQIHVSPSKMREVQALYQTLLGIIGQHQKEGEKIDPYDIVVMAPDINVYEPMIKAVFRSAHSLLDCQMMDLNPLDDNNVIKGFFSLLAVAESRWENEVILNLFSFSAFREKQKINQVQVNKIEKWVHKTGIRWGMDAAHRSELLLKEHCATGMSDVSAGGTWKMGFDRLLLGTAMVLPSTAPEKVHYTRRPIHEINATDQELLGQWVALIKALKRDLSPLNGRKKRQLKEWSEILTDLLNQYFSWDRVSDDEKAQVDALIEALESLKSFGFKNRERYPFSTVIFHLKKTLARQEVHYRESHFQAVRFCSMLPMRAVPAKVVAMIGLGEENFPRKDEKMALNQLYNQKGGDPFPNATEFDRYLFLEAVMSARNYLILSYSKSEGGGDALQGASLLISELVHYLDQSFLIGQRPPSAALIHNHPFYSFDKSYFLKESRLRSYSKSDYAAALSYYHSENKAIHRFIPTFSIKEPRSEPLETIDIKEIKRLARNPFRFYFQKRLGIFLKEEEENISEETFVLSPLALSEFRKASARIEVGSLLQAAELEGKTPVGPFKHFSIEKVMAETAELSEHMAQFSLDSGDLFEVVFSPICQEPYWEEGRWVVPPLTVELEGGAVQLVGTLGECSKEGMVSYKKGSKQDLFEQWPLYLIWCYLLEVAAPPFKKDLLFMRSGRRNSSWLASSQAALKAYLSYYFLAKESVSPLIPEWVEAFCQKDPSAVKAEVKRCLDEDAFYNDEVKWICREGQAFDLEAMHQAWTGQAQDLFFELIAQWGSKKK